MMLRLVGPAAILVSAILAASLATAQVQIFTATHTYILGDHDSKDDARQRCLLEVKRKVLEQAGIHIESTSEVKDFDLTKDKITSFAAAVMQVKDTKEDVGFEQGHMTMTLTITAQVDLAEVHKQLAARQVDAGVRDDVAAQSERLKRLEAQLEATQKQIHLAPGRTSASQPIDISAVDLQTLRALATSGNAMAQVELGLRYVRGDGVPEDGAQAAKWFKKAATQGHADAQLMLGLAHKEGVGVPQDYAQAAKWYRKAAEQGHAVAQDVLGNLYYEGLGVPREYALARKWYEKAAAQGLSEAQYKLGVLYALGWGVAKDYAIARQWFEKASARGNTDAQHFLGSLYYNGQGVPQDYTTARQWWEKAATQGDIKGQTALGMLYANGEGVPQDYTQARQWYEKAAAQGHNGAQILLGELYSKGGEGVPQNDVRAYMWFSLAAAALIDIDDAAGRRDRVASRMTPAQLAEAQRLTREWRDAFQKR